MPQKAFSLKDFSCAHQQLRFEALSTSSSKIVWCEWCNALEAQFHRVVLLWSSADTGARVSDLAHSRLWDILSTSPPHHSELNIVFDLASVREEMNSCCVS